MSLSEVSGGQTAVIIAHQETTGVDTDKLSKQERVGRRRMASLASTEPQYFVHRRVKNRQGNPSLPSVPSRGFVEDCCSGGAAFTYLLFCLFLP